MIRDYGSLALIAIFLIFCCDTTSSECRQSTPCVCLDPNGPSYDLTALSRLGILSAKSKNDDIFYFHPCSNIRFPNNAANVTIEGDTGNGVSIWVYNHETKKNVSLGTVEEMTMKIVEDNPFFLFHHGTVVTSIELVCCNSCGTELSVSPIVHTSQIDLVLISPYACKEHPSAKGISVGSLLVIIVLVLAGLYFIGGAIVLKLLRGATGWEMLPNHEFWCGLPGHIRDGCAYVFNCCRTDSYQSI